MSYGKILSNCGTGMQQLFQRAKGRLNTAFHGEPVKPYSKLTKDERMQRDLEMMEPDFDFSWGKKRK